MTQQPTLCRLIGSSANEQSAHSLQVIPFSTGALARLIEVMIVIQFVGFDSVD